MSTTLIASAAIQAVYAPGYGAFTVSVPPGQGHTVNIFADPTAFVLVASIPVGGVSATFYLAGVFYVQSSGNQQFSYTEAIDNRSVVGNSISHYQSGGPTIGSALLTGAHSVYSVLAGNSDNNLYYLHVWDSLTVPSAGDSTAKVKLPVGLGIAQSPTENSRTFASGFLPFSVGVSAAWSSTQATYTAVTPTSAYMEMNYV